MKCRMRTNYKLRFKIINKAIKTNFQFDNLTYNSAFVVCKFVGPLDNYETSSGIQSSTLTYEEKNKMNKMK